MATVINNPAQTESNSGMGFLVGVVLLILFVLFLIGYGLPYLQSITQTPQVNIPGKVDINVNTPGK